MMAIKQESVLVALLGIWLQISSGVLRGQCNVCLTNNVACLDERQFASCLNGKLTNNLTRCPANAVCTDEPIICKSQYNGFRPVCFNDNCGTCEPTNGAVACLDKNTYGFCYGGTEIVPETIKTCPIGSVCNFESLNNICVDEAAGGTASCDPEEPTTTTDVPTTTTIPTPTPTPTPTTETQIPTIDPDAFCANRRETGNFKAADDLTCKEFIYCFLLAGQYLGNRYICEGYFNAETAKCQKTKPNDC